MNRTLSAVLATVLLLAVTACRTPPAAGQQPSTAPDQQAGAAQPGAVAPATTEPQASESAKPIREFLTEQKTQERGGASVAGLRKKARIEVLV